MERRNGGGVQAGQDRLPGHPGPRGERGRGGGVQRGECWGGRRGDMGEKGRLWAHQAKTLLCGMSAHHIVAVDPVCRVLHAVVDFPPEY